MSYYTSLAEKIAIAFIHFGLEVKNQIGIYAKNRPEWVITDLTCSFVVLLSEKAEYAIHFILKHSNKNFCDSIRMKLAKSLKFDFQF